MDDPLVSTLVVMLTSTTATTFTDLDVVNDHAPITLPAKPSPIILPAEHPPLLPPAEPPPIEVLVDPLQTIDQHQCSCFSSGSMIDVATFDYPPSLPTPFEFPLDPKADKYYDSMLAELPDIPPMIDSATQVFSTPRVCGLVGDS